MKKTIYFLATFLCLVGLTGRVGSQERPDVQRLLSLSDSNLWGALTNANLKKANSQAK